MRLFSSRFARKLLLSYVVLALISLALSGEIHLWSVLACAFLAISVTLWIMKGIEGPVDEMLRVVRAIKGGRMEERVRRNVRSDLDKLGDEINGMADELRLRSALAKEEKEKLDLALSALMTGVITVDSSEHLVFWNDPALHFLDWVAPPTYGKPISELIRVSAVLEMVREVGRLRSSVSREIVQYRANQEKIFTVHAMPCSLLGGVGTMVVLRDDTNVRRLERMRQDFVMSASHELKTPLTAIKGYVDTLLEGADRDETARRRFLEQLSANVNRLVALADDLLNLSRIETSEVGVDLTPQDCQRLLIESVEQYRKIAEKKGITLSLEPSSIQIQILSHADSVRQVVGNLLDNAIKYTKAPGKVTVRVARNGMHAAIEVSDTGVGISKADLDRIFERFYRVDKARSIEAGGTGLGLSIVKHIVSLLKGRIDVKSEPGVGSSFTVFLPLS